MPYLKLFLFIPYFTLFSLILLTKSIGVNSCAPYLGLYPVHPLFRFIYVHSIDAIYRGKLLCAIFKTFSLHPLFRIFSLILMTQSIDINSCALYLKLYPVHPLFRFSFVHSIDAVYWPKLLCAIFKTLSCVSLISPYFRFLLTQLIGVTCCAPYLKL